MSHRHSTTLRPDADADAGVEGNSRLTASSGVLLTGLLFVEGITILSLRQLITLHIFLGLLLIGPVLLKTGSTIYRFSRYYSRVPSYVRRGPPQPMLRILGPLVIVFTLAMLGTGAALLARKPGQAGLLLPAHKASFIIWFALMAVHVLGHAREAAAGTWRELRPARGNDAARRRAVRLAALTISLAVGVGLAAGLTPAGSSWTGPRANIEQHR